MITLGYAFITVPKGLVNGGVTSFAMVLGKISGVDVALLVNGAMIFLLLVCLIFLGRDYFIGALFSGGSYMGLFTLFHRLGWEAPLPIWGSVLVVGVLVGIGCYLCISAKSTTIGFDTVALILHKRNPAVNIAKAMGCCNVVVLSLGFFVYGLVSIAAGLSLTLVQTWVLNCLLKRFPLERERLSRTKTPSGES